MEYPKKLIEVALPLDDINREAAREKSIRHGHPSTLHLWWARRPLAAARAVLFAQLVNDPGGKRGYQHKSKSQTKEEALKERERLFDIIRELVKWENTNNEELLERARAEIRKSWEETCKITGDDPSKLPAFHDPFAGGGAIPLEAQRLGLEAYASDLNPVAVLINKAMIEIPPKFAGKPPVNPEARQDKELFKRNWKGAQGLAEDVRYYGKWMRDEAEKRIGHLYPQVEVTEEMAKEGSDLKGFVGKKLNVIAWIWARSVKSPNPAYSHLDTPLVRSFWLSTKKNKERWIEPILEGHTLQFKVRTKGKPKIEATVQRGQGICIYSGVPIEGNYIKTEAKAGRMSLMLLAMVCDSEQGRIFLPPLNDHIQITKKITPKWKPKSKLPLNRVDYVPPPYGIETHGDLFTNRQLVILSELSDLVLEVCKIIEHDAEKIGIKGHLAENYVQAICTYLGMAVSRSANTLNAFCVWSQSREQSVNMFSRQVIPMAWDFPEVNPFAKAAGDYGLTVESIAKIIRNFDGKIQANVLQIDAAKQDISADKIISTDPPYYDNIGYADLSDFFYVWLKRTLLKFYPELFSTILTPKTEELIVTPGRNPKAENYKDDKTFLEGMSRAFTILAEKAHPVFPITIYYAFKQSDSSAEGTISTGWEIFLEAIIKSGFLICGTWPMRTERDQGVKTGSNVLASSIILVCRKLSKNANPVSRKQFLRELTESLPAALEDMIGGTEAASPIAPVDLAQAAIGPGMAVFSKYKAVLEADGTPMSVHNALILINKAIDEYFTEAEGEMDADTRFCVDWFQQYGFKEGVFGEADVLARAKGTSVEGVQEAGVILAKAGKVRLLKVTEYPDSWNPQSDKRVPIWEACHQMCRALQVSETRAGELLARMPEKAEAIRQLAYRLYTLCERKKWADHAALYNGLITSWHAILEESHKVGHARTQQELFSG